MLLTHWFFSARGYPGQPELVVAYLFADIYPAVCLRCGRCPLISVFVVVGIFPWAAPQRR